jgi:thioredoxin reductase
MRSMRVLVVGGGIGGLSAALGGTGAMAPSASLGIGSESGASAGVGGGLTG